MYQNGVISLFQRRLTLQARAKSGSLQINLKTSLRSSSINTAKNPSSVAPKKDDVRYVHD
jgi:hypothetical protein